MGADWHKMCPCMVPLRSSSTPRMHPSESCPGAAAGAKSKACFSLNSLTRERLTRKEGLSKRCCAHASRLRARQGSRGERPVMQFPFPEPSTSSQSCSPRYCTASQQPGSAPPQPLWPAAVCSCCNHQQRTPEQQQSALRHPAAWRPLISAPTTPLTSSIGACAAAWGLLAPRELRLL